jgi:hypothetical protein
MNRISFTLIFCIVVINCLFSQLQIDLKFGQNYSKLNSILLHKGDRDSYKKEQALLKYGYFVNGGLNLEYKIGKISLSSGAIISFRGALDYDFRAPREGYVRFSYTFLEIPLIISYHCNNDKFSFGTGLNIAKRAFANTRVYSERNYSRSLDFRAQVQYNMTQRWKIELSYTFGNIDKYFSHIHDNYLFNVFGLDVCYTIVRSKKKK